MNLFRINKNSVILFVVIGYLIVYKLSAQDTSPFLLSIDKELINVYEFEQSYQKNINVLEDNSQKALDNYLELFINFKLKVHAARKLGLDTVSSYKKELLHYREQLIEPYLKDESLVQKLVLEAYERLERDIDASHILIQLPPQATPKDTLEAFETISKLRNRIIGGENFEKIAVAYSQDPSVQDNNGNLGYFTAFNMVYPFETACFTTKVGKVSLPFRTQFGYHLVKVNDNRPTLGEVEVAHIMFNAAESESVMNEVYQQILNGTDFSMLAKRYSIDQNTSSNGGKMSKFRSGRLIKAFEDVAFNLKEGQVSTPFKTPYGWHIVKLIKKHPLKPFSDLQPELIVRVKQDQRSEILINSLAKKLLNKYDYKENPILVTILNDLHAFMDDEILFSIDTENFKVKQFKSYLEQHPNKNILDVFINYRNTQLIDYYKTNLEQENFEFASIMKEYEEGLLLFEILQRAVWDKSAKDTLGLKLFYKRNKSNYKWKQRVNATIISTDSEKNANNINNYLIEGYTIENIKKDFTKNNQNVEVKSGIFEEESLHLPNNFEFRLGLSVVYSEGDKFKIIQVDELLAPTPKSFEEAKGVLINDYQQYIEQQWITQLRKTIPVTINQQELKKLKQKYL